MSPEVGKSIAAGFALAGFAVALVSGLAVDNPVTRTLQCAIVSMVLCYLGGLAIGAVASRVGAEHLASFRASNPIGENKESTGAGSP